MTFGAVLKIDPSAISRRTEHTPANQYHTRHSSVKVKLNSSKLTNINKTHMPQIFKNSDERTYLRKFFEPDNMSFKRVSREVFTIFSEVRKFQASREVKKRGKGEFGSRLELNLKTKVSKS